MTIDERVHHAMSGLRLRTDELGRPPSHDEVAELLRRVVQEAEDELRSELAAEGRRVEELELLRDQLMDELAEARASAQDKP